MALTGMALALAVAFAATGHAQGTPQAMSQTSTHTTLTSETREVSGHTVASFTALVLSADGTPGAGSVTLIDRNREIAGAALNSEGKAFLKLDTLAAGDHLIYAVYGGDDLHIASKSESLVIHPQTTVTPDFGLSIAPATLTLKAGTAGTSVVTVAPVTGSGFTGFVSLSCSGAANSGSLPIGVTCTFAPANLQLTSAASGTSNLSIQTEKSAGKNAENSSPAFLPKNPLVLAVILPGMFGLGFLGRKSRLLQRSVLLLALGMVCLLGTSACSARYAYLHHGPSVGGTPAGTYTITVTAQTSNGVSASAHSTTLALTVN